MKTISRRDFLKLALTFSGGALLSAAGPRFLPSTGPTGTQLPNVIVIVLDAMTAKNLSLYGYRRKTTPHFERFASRATVYHQHYSAGNYTTPGTASLLTGMLPWTHRAINLAGLVTRDLADRNLFTLLGPRYHRFVYSQNIGANYILNQFAGSIETYLPPGRFSAAEQVLGPYFPKDLNTAYRSFDDFLITNDTLPGSLLFGSGGRLAIRREAAIAEAAGNEYPEGMPFTANYPIFFRLKDVFEGVRGEILQFKPPTFAYFHLWAPHSPYRPVREYMGIFDDNWRPEKKPLHRLGSQIRPSHLNTRRLHYDEYIANLDAEFGVLIDSLDKNGILDNSYVILTSDHGESFERGVDTHVTPLLYETLVHIPLIVSAPAQQGRRDVYSPTSCVDILPTILNLTDTPVPQWCEGQILPGLGGPELPDRSLFAMEAKTNPAFSPLDTVSVMLRKGRYKLTCYRGFQREDAFELYDIEADPEEIDDIYPRLRTVADSMRDELIAGLEAANRKYRL